MKSSRFAALVALSVGLATAPLAFAAGSGNHSHGHGSTASIGTPGGTPTRTVTVTMYDNYYEPEQIAVRHGETVQFVVKNAGSFVHEFNINTPDDHASHGPHMQMMVDMGMIGIDKINRTAMAASKGTNHDMSHDEPNSVLLEPGESRSMVWTFDTDAGLEFACNIPGHYDSGMAGDIAIAH